MYLILFSQNRNILDLNFDVELFTLVSFYSKETSSVMFSKILPAIVGFASGSEVASTLPHKLAGAGAVTQNRS